MSKKAIWCIIIVLIVIIIFCKVLSNDNDKDFKPLEKNIGDEFTELDYKNNE